VDANPSWPEIRQALLQGGFRFSDRTTIAKPD
jgi:hypothetical protein